MEEESKQEMSKFELIAIKLRLIEEQSREAKEGIRKHCIFINIKRDK